MHRLKVKNKELMDINDIVQKRNTKHQQKQRQLIKKLSYEQVANKQLQYEVQKLAQELLQMKDSQKNTDSKAWQIGQIIKKSQAQKTHFISVLRKTCEILLQVQNHDDFIANSLRVRQFIKKNLKIAQSSSNINFDLDFKFEVTKVSDLKQRCNSLQQTIKRLKTENEQQKQEKKRIINTYNEKILKLKETYQILKRRVQEKQRANEEQVYHLKQIIQDKKDLINDMKSRFQHFERPRKDSSSFYASKRKSREKSKSVKKSFIGDGQLNQYPNFNQYKLDDLENQIEELEKKLIKELRD